MTNSKHVHFYWVGPLLFGPLQCISLGGPDPPGINAPGLGAKPSAVGRFFAIF